MYAKVIVQHSSLSFNMNLGLSFGSAGVDRRLRRCAATLLIFLQKTFGGSMFISVQLVGVGWRKFLLSTTYLTPRTKVKNIHTYCRNVTKRVQFSKSYFLVEVTSFSVSFLKVKTKVHFFPNTTLVGDSELRSRFKLRSLNDKFITMVKFCASFRSAIPRSRFSVAPSVSLMEVQTEASFSSSFEAMSSFGFKAAAIFTYSSSGWTPFSCWQSLASTSAIHSIVPFCKVNSFSLICSSFWLKVFAMLSGWGTVHCVTKTCLKLF